MYKLIVPRVPGDDVLFDSIVYANVKNISTQTEIINITDDYPNETIHSKYFKALINLKENDLKDDDVLIFCHNDCGIIDPLFKEKVDRFFETTDVALLGFVGSSKMKEDLCWWNSEPQYLRGHLMQGNKDDNNATHLIKGAIGFYNDLIMIDGFCFVTLGKYFKNFPINFDNSYKGNHFYDMDLCRQFMFQDLKIGVADILMYHKSPGSSPSDENWKSDRANFLLKADYI